MNTKESINEAEHREPLRNWLEGFAIPELERRCKDRWIAPSSDAEGAFHDGRFHLRARARGGYLYVSAWETEVAQ